MLIYNEHELLTILDEVVADLREPHHTIACQLLGRGPFRTKTQVTKHLHIQPATEYPLLLAEALEFLKRGLQMRGVKNLGDVIGLIPASV